MLPVDSNSNKWFALIPNKNYISALVAGDLIGRNRLFSRRQRWLKDF